MTPTLNMPLDELGFADARFVDGQGDLVYQFRVATTHFRCEWPLQMPSPCAGGRLEIEAGLDTTLARGEKEARMV